MSERSGSQEAGSDRQPSPPPARPPDSSAAGRVPEQASQPADPTPDTADDSAAADAAARIAELEDMRLRTLADLDNLRKRCASQVSRAEDETRALVARQWLPVVDNLERALAHAEADPSSIIQGITAIRDQATSLLAGLGFPRRSDDLGAAFDPARHEAIASRSDPAAPAGSVVQVVQPGYGVGDHQLRPAQVIVAKAD
jgi:molecular chaperone GrpE